MENDTTPGQPYEPPSIEERSPIALPLIGTAAASIPPQATAVFRTSPSEPYEPPCVEARDPIGIPLIGGPASSQATSAAFRP
jgi:hypothetical protein